MPEQIFVLLLLQIVHQLDVAVGDLLDLFEPRRSSSSEIV